MYFWAKTIDGARPGISVRDHCVNVGCVAEAVVSMLTESVRGLFPPGAVTLAASHDVGKITLGFQAKSSPWRAAAVLPGVSDGEIALSPTDHARVSQVCLQRIFATSKTRLWAVAVGAHHGRHKGRTAQMGGPEALADWADGHRRQLLDELQQIFGELPGTPPNASLAHHLSDLWCVAGMITVADWIGSNEEWFSPERGAPLKATRQQAREALRQIGWPGGALRVTSFTEAFADGPSVEFSPNSLQRAVADLARTPGVVVVEGPMGCGKTEAALFAAQQLIASGQQQGIYFALPTQVTSNRIHNRIDRFLRRTLATGASLRLAHGNAWLEEDFDMRLRPAFNLRKPSDGDDPNEDVREARSWFASAKQALLAPYGVGTVDQALQAVVAVKHFFVRRFALAGKVVILDEVHSYDIYTGTLITALIRELTNLRCSVIILSATLTVARRRELLAAAGIEEKESNAAYPLVSGGAAGCPATVPLAPTWKDRDPVALRAAFIPEQEVIDTLIARAEAGQHVLWIRNTVVEAQQAFRAVAGSIREGSVPVGLLHSRFPFRRREELEDEWLDRLGKNRSVEGMGSILIATQVVEQSVDIDLDFMVTDLAPTDLLFQRLGRLWRHERPHRCAAQPEFWVRLPELPVDAGARGLKKAVGRSARVYAPYVLLRTLAIWREQSVIRLPGDIRPWLEATYADPAADEPAAWSELRLEVEKEKQTLAANANAATRVLGNTPMLDDQEEVLTRRKGAPTTSVVLLRAAEPGTRGLTTLTSLDDKSIEVSDHEWHRNAARFLQLWTVRVPRYMVPVDRTPPPRWLALHGPRGVVAAFVRDDGHCVFGDIPSPVIYDLRLGVYADDTPQAAPRQWTHDDEDDEFDY